jgi:hypothetical protein
MLSGQYEWTKTYITQYQAILIFMLSSKWTCWTRKLCLGTVSRQRDGNTWCRFHTRSGLVAVLMTSFTDAPFFSSCSVLPLSVREVQWNDFFLFASYVLLFFLFQIFLLLPHSYLFMFCSAFVHSLQQVYDERRIRAKDTYNGKLYHIQDVFISNMWAQHGCRPVYHVLYRVCSLHANMGAQHGCRPVYHVLYKVCSLRIWGHSSVAVGLYTQRGRISTAGGESLFEWQGFASGQRLGKFSHNRNHSGSGALPVCDYLVVSAAGPRSWWLKSIIFRIEYIKNIQSVASAPHMPGYQSARRVDMHIFVRGFTETRPCCVS